MATTVVGLFDTQAEAHDVVRDLAGSGFRQDQISMIANNVRGEPVVTTADADEVSGAAVGAGAGAAVGGGVGLLAGLGLLAIPGIGPVLAAGPLVGLLAGAGVGAATGGIIGALVDLGASEEEAEYYAEGIRRGGTLVAVHVEDDLAENAANIMRSHNAVNVRERAEAWRREGWSRFDETAEPYCPPGEYCPPARGSAHAAIYRRVDEGPSQRTPGEEAGRQREKEMRRAQEQERSYRPGEVLPPM